MHVAVVAVSGKNQIICARERQAQELENLHALAIARALPAYGCSPCLICDFQPQGLDIPTLLPVSGSPFSFFRLWRWQRQCAELFVLAIGDRSLKLARFIQRMSRNSRLFAYFPILAPKILKSGMLRRLSSCFYGSSFIAASLEKSFDRIKDASRRPALAPAPPGISLVDYQFPSRQWREGERFVFGMAESLLPASGAHLVVRAMSALWQHEDIPAWEIRMFGSGPAFTEIMSEAERLGVLSRLDLLAEQPLAEVSSRCHVWLAPGSSDWELPSTLWAGFAAGLPVVASDSALHKERLLGPDTVIRVSTENPQELARAMLELLRNGQLRARLAGQDSRAFISLEGMAGRVCELVRDSQKRERTA